jgi:cytochrome c
MSTHSLTAVAMGLIAVTGYTCSMAQETPNLGRPATLAEVAGWDISIPPAGTGLPPGSSTPEQGAMVER